MTCQKHGLARCLYLRKRDILMQVALAIDVMLMSEVAKRRWYERCISHSRCHDALPTSFPFRRIWNGNEFPFTILTAAFQVPHIGDFRV
jgi:hypothetical protein